MNVVIVTRHQGMIDWLAQRGITGKVISHATPADIIGKDVVGNLPLGLASLANSVTTVDLPDLPADMRGKDLTPDQMDAYGATLSTYIVRAL